MVEISMKSIVIILPAYNEELTICEAIANFHKQLPSAHFLVVNNNSSDKTELFAVETMRRFGINGNVIREHRQGKGHAVRRAFLEFEADIYLLCDADLTYPSERVHDLIQPILSNQADMVVADRISNGHYAKENSRRFHNFGNHLVRALVNGLFHANLGDIMSGYRAFSRQFIKHYPVLAEGFELETDLTLHALDKRFRILEIPIEYRDRPNGSLSKLNTFADGTKVIFTIAHILRYYKPLFFFGVISFVTFVLGVIAGTPVINDWLTHRYIYHVPLAILAASLELFALNALGIGLVLDSITHMHRFNFELALLNSIPDESRVEFGLGRPRNLPKFK